jgi:hypothetical protein
MLKAPDKFFKKKHIYILLAHGEEDSDKPRTPVPNHTYAALTSECGNPLVLSKNAEDQLFAYDKQVLIPTSRSDVARTESTLMLKGAIRNRLTRAVKPAEFKLYIPTQVPSYNVRYNSIPHINVSPLVVVVSKYNVSTTYRLSPITPETYITSENREVHIYASGLYSKTHAPHLPPECTGAPPKANLNRTPAYADNYVALLIPNEYYTAPLRECVHTNAMYNVIAFLMRMMQDSYLSFTDVCAYVSLYQLYGNDYTYEQFAHTRKWYANHILRDIRNLTAHRAATNQPAGYDILQSSFWAISLNDLLHATIPLHHILEHIRSMNSADTDTLLIVPVCRGLKDKNTNNEYTNQNRETIRIRRAFSQRTPKPSAKSTRRRIRYKWKKQAVPVPTSTPSSVRSSSSNRSGYTNYSDFPTPP